MRLAFITVGDTSRPTGGYLYNARLLSGLRDRGVEVEEVVASGASEADQEAVSESFGSRFDAAEFDAVAVDALACVVCAPHLDRWREVRPLVALFHVLPSLAGGLDPDSEPAARARRLEEPLLRADALVTVSRHAKSVLEERGVWAEKVHVAPPGFDRSGIVVETERRGDQAPRVLCVGQWIERKGVLELVRAWRSRERKDAELQLVGETDADPAYAARVHEAIGDDPSIIVSGPLWKEDLQRAYSGADAFALPSRYEGYGMVYAEALGSGLPVIACGVGPVPEILGEDAALLVPPGDVDPLSGALDRMLADPDLRARMSAAARERAGTLPLWKDTVAGFHEALKQASLERSRV